MARQGVAPAQELPAAQTARASAAAQGLGLRAPATGAGARLSDTRLIAPMDGVVLSRRVDPGALVGPSTGPVLTVVATDALRVFVPVTERDAASVQLGQTAELTVDALPGRTFSARVSRLAPAFDPVTRTLDAEVLVPNPDGALRPGMYGRALIVTGVHPGAVVAPVSALQRAGERWFAFVVRDGRASRREVAVGIEDGEDLEVTRGLSAGDELITAGLDALSDNAAVRVARGADPFHGPAAQRPGHGG